MHTCVCVFVYNKGSRRCHVLVVARFAKKVKICNTQKNTYAHTYMYIHMYTCTYAHMYICTYVHVYMCTYVCTYLHVHTYEYMCVCVLIQHTRVFIKEKNIGLAYRAQYQQHELVCVCIYVLYVCTCVFIQHT